MLAFTQDACYARVKSPYMYPVRDQVLGRPNFDYKRVAWTSPSESPFRLTIVFALCLRVLRLEFYSTIYGHREIIVTQNGMLNELTQHNPFALTNGSM